MAYKEIKTSDLSGVALDWASAQAMGIIVLIKNKRVWLDDESLYFPSVYWAQGGPIIENGRIDINATINQGADVDEWRAVHGIGKNTKTRYGKTPLEAALRCYVSTRLGNIVSVPVELLEVTA